MQHVDDQHRAKATATLLLAAEWLPGAVSAARSSLSGLCTPRAHTRVRRVHKSTLGVAAHAISILSLHTHLRTMT